MSGAIQEVGWTAIRRLREESALKTIDELSDDFSLETMVKLMLWMLLATGVGWSCLFLPQAVAQESELSSSHVAKSVAILVPVDRAGKFTGDMVYVPGAVYAELFPAAAPSKPQDARFQSATYGVRIDSSVTNGADRLDRTTIEAEYLVHIEDGDRINNQVRLPFSPGSVRRIELLGDVNRILQKKELSDHIIATLPRGDAFRLRVTLMPTIQQADPWTKLKLPIPKVSSSWLSVETDQNIDALRVGGEKGYLLQETDLRRWADHIGPTGSLEIDYRTVAKANTVIAEPLKRRYWISAGKRHVTIDCEVGPPRSVAAGETFQFVVLDGEMPRIVSSAWKLTGSELYSPTRRRLLTFTSMRDSPGPVRLLWTQAATLNREDELDPVAIPIPEVIAAALGENAAAWIATHCDSALQFAPLVGDDTERLSVGHFVDEWTGFRGRIDHAYRVLNDLPSPVLQSKSMIHPSVRQRHHLHVMPDRLELHYTAVLSPSDRLISRLTLQVPPNVELVGVSKDGQPLAGQSIRAGDSSEVLLGSINSSNAVTIKAIGVQPLTSTMRFSQPQFALKHLPPTSGLYAMSRDRSVVVREVQPPSMEVVSAEVPVSAEELARGWLPVSNWQTESGRSTETEGSTVGGTFEVKVRPTRFDCRQLIALTRDEEGWEAETLIRFRTGRTRLPAGRQIPDFVDVAIPTRWCESLVIRPRAEFSRQQATDPAFQVIRIACDQDLFQERTLSIRGRLLASDTGRVNVPPVRVLGSGDRQVHISVPDEFSGDPIQWRTSAVEASKLPPAWEETRYAGQQRSSYAVANPSWSMDLAPLPEVDVDAYVSACDTQVFAQNNGALVMSHWDLFPGGLESVEVRLPRGATLLGAWSAGKAVVTHQTSSDDGAGNSKTDRVVSIPLALSRLAQPIQLLLRVPATAAKQGRYLPELIGIPASQNWLAKYIPTPAVTSREVTGDQGRAVQLATSVVEAVESIESERPRDECAAWLQLWLDRYQEIAASVGHRPVFEITTEELELGEPTLTSGSGSFGATNLAVLTSNSQWKQLDSRMTPYVKRFLPDAGREIGDDQLDTYTQTDSFQFGVANFDGFVLEQVTSLSVGNRPRSVQPVSSNDLGLRNLIVNGLTLIVVCGLLVCLRPFQRYAVPFVVHPAFWLGLMGIFGFAVAPIPVAWALVLVAVALPVFPSKRSPRAGSVP